MAWSKIAGLIFFAVMGIGALIGFSYDLATVRQERKRSRPNSLVIEGRMLDAKACLLFFSVCVLVAIFLIVH